ncbi:MAG: sulfite exporter TauE/SafE family protein, partial [Candidatus Caldarchaeum sp.]
RKAGMLAAVTSVSAPVGALLVQYVEQRNVWIVYFAAALYLVYRLFRKAEAMVQRERFMTSVALAFPISVLSGFLGVGPGFLLMPTLIVLGNEPKRAAGINAFAVTPPSFTSLIPHLTTAKWDFMVMPTLLVVGAVGSFVGARITSTRVPSPLLKRLFAALIVLVTVYKLYTLLA